MKKGWILLHRELLDHPIWTVEPFTRGQAWVDLLLLANHKNGFIRRRGILVGVKRGQVGMSERNLAKRWKWSRGKVRRFLFELERKMVHQIVQQKDNVTSIITITNYDRYQQDSTTNSTTDGPQTDHRRYQNKECKRMIKKEKNIYPAEFEIFWTAYPKRKGRRPGSKPRTLRLWQKLPDEDKALLMEAVRNYANEQDPEYIKDADGWLNNERWRSWVGEPDRVKTKEDLEWERRIEKAKEEDAKSATDDV